MGKRKPNAKYQKKKRKFNGNYWTKKRRNEELLLEVEDQPAMQLEDNVDIVGEEDAAGSGEGESIPSKAKLIPESILNESIDSIDEDVPNGTRFIDISNLIEFVNRLSCPCCHATNCTSVTESRQGLSSIFQFKCDSCGNTSELKTSKTLTSKTKPSAEVNNRAVFAMCAIGGHHHDLQRFCGSMNIPSKMSERTWNSHMKKIHSATEKCSRASMRRAGDEVRGDITRDEVVNTTVSCDGTWQRRGFSSKNGIGTVLSVAGKKSKVLDVHVLSNHCGVCMKKKKALNDEDFQKWFESHDCNKNYNGSSGGMEPSCMETIFKRSVETHNVRYTGYLGDGDSKSFHRVSKATPPIYGEEQIVKLECCGHVQKRMGKHLTEKVKAVKSTTYMHEGKSVKGISGGGKGRLTAAKIKRLQGHYGGAIRNNAGDVPAMRKAVWAAWKHRGGDHVDCGTWCPAKDGNIEEANKNNFAPYVLNAIKPVYENLAREQLLQACSHGGNQNTNESYHNNIWERCPKQTFVGRKRLELAAYDAAIVYNDGESGRLPIFKELGFPSGDHCQRYSYLKDKQRIRNAKRMSSKSAKKIRKNRRIEATDIEERQKQSEGEVYVPGGF